MTRSAPFTSKTARPISISRLDTGGLGRLCNALEIMGFLSSQKAGNPAKEAHLLHGLQHPKAEKLITDSPEGPQLDLNVFTVKELKSLAECLGTKLTRDDRKADIILKVSHDVAGSTVTQDKLARHEHDLESRAKTQSHQLTSNSATGSLSASKSQHLFARTAPSASQHSSDYTTAAARESATALVERAQPGMAPSESAAQAHWASQPVQQADMPMPHRKRDPIRTALRKLFGRHKQVAVASDTTQSLDKQEAAVAALQKAYAAPPAQQAQQEQQAQQAQQASTSWQRPKTQTEADRATLEQQWQVQEESRVVQADQWASPDMVQFLKEVKQLHSRKKGQAVPEAVQILERLQYISLHVQGYEAFANQPSAIVSKGSTDFGGRSGFAMLIRGPEQYLTKGPGYIYVYYIKEAPDEFKVGVSKDLPERRTDSGKLVGRVVNQSKQNNKQYLLSESFQVPHRTLVDEVLKVRLKQWRFSHLDRGDGYTEWFRNIVIDDLKAHIRDVIRVVTALYPAY